jgi:chaperone BCS1
MVLLEDIDVARHSRSQDKEEAKDSGSTFKIQGDKEAEERSTAVWALNALDGVGSQEGLVLVMTTNYISGLDDALIRPGHVDRKVQFRLAGRDIILPHGQGERDCRATYR